MTTQLEDVRRPQTYEPCEECGAPMDPQQRYCVNCAARRGNGANPSSRYFAAMSKRARRPLTRPPAKAGPASRAAAVGFFALLPIAVALGVVVGRSGSGDGDNEALLQALREQAGDRRQHRRRPDRHGDDGEKAKKKPRPAKPTPKAKEKSSPRPKTATSTKSPASTPRKRRKPKTPIWSKKTPNRPAKTTSRPSRTCRT